jgi:membrane protease YdiL (CAAX protease family)
MGFLVTVCVMALVYFTHMLGAMTLQQLQGDTRILLGLEFMIYAVSLGAAIPVFSIAWRRNFFAGVQWHGATAGRFWIRLIGVALAGNIIAGVANLTLPFPKNAPIDQLFKTPMQAWLLFAFGVTVAPFFEEMIFRGFLLPALATAWDWCGEKISGSAPKLYDVTQDPPWSLGAKIFGSILASLPFALMHAAQVSNAWGPLSVLFTVSLILCAVRLKTRSLAASTLVHVTYNFTLFAAMLVQNGGFRHLDKM